MENDSCTAKKYNVGVKGCREPLLQTITCMHILLIWIDYNNIICLPNMLLKKISYFHSINISTIPRFITGKRLDIWDNSLNILKCSALNFHDFTIIFFHFSMITQINFYTFTHFTFLIPFSVHSKQNKNVYNL